MAANQIFTILIVTGKGEWKFKGLTAKKCENLLFMDVSEWIPNLPKFAFSDEIT